MGTAVNNGEQIIRWHYHFPIRSDIMGERVHELLPAGVYSGFTLSAAGAGNVQISAGHLEIKDDANRTQIRCQMTENYTVTITTAAPFVHAYWTYNEEKEWYVDFVGLASGKGTSANVLSNYVCLGQALFNGGSVTGFNDTHRQEAKFLFSLNRQQIDNILLNMLSAGANIALVYLSGANKLLVSASPGALVHGILINLSADDHPQYMLVDASRSMSASWNIGAGRTITAATISASSLSAGIDVYINGKDIVETVEDRQDQLLVPAGGISLLYDDAARVMHISASDTTTPFAENINNQVFSSVRGNVEYRTTSGTSGFKSIETEIDRELQGGNYWEEKAAMTTHRIGPAAFSLSGYSYVTMGRIFATSASSAFTDSTERYDDTLDSWQSVASLSVVGRYRTGSYTLEGYGWVFCGYNELSGPVANWYNDNYRYDPAANVWAALGNTGLTKRSGPGAFAIGELGYSCGGLTTAGAYSSAVEAYNPSTNVWSTKSDMLSAAYLPTSMKFEQFGYIAKGQTIAGSYFGVNQKYDPMLNSWMIKTAGSVVMAAPGSFVINGLGYSCLGSSAASTYTTLTDRFNHYTNSWNVMLPSLSGQTEPAGFALNGFGYVVAGLSGSVIHGTNAKYRNVTLWEIPETFRFSKLTPRKIIVGTNIQGIRKSLPIWIQTSAGPAGTSAWYSMLSNHSSVKAGSGSSAVSAYLTPQTTAGITGAAPAVDGIYDYRIRVGLPENILGIFKVDYWSYISDSNFTRPHPWSQTTSFATQRLNGYVYTFGNTVGATAISAGDECNRYSPGTDTWIHVKSLLTAAYPTSFELEGFGFAVGGGTRANHLIKNLQRFNDVSQIWVEKTQMPISGQNNSGHSLNNYGYVAGGASGNGAASIHHGVLQYNLVSDSWKFVADMPGRRSWGGMFSVNKYLYYVDGMNESAANQNDTYKYNDTINSWTSEATAILSRALIGSWDLNGHGFVAGGSIAAMPLVENATEMYNADGDYWRACSDMNQRREGTEGNSCGKNAFMFLGALQSGDTTYNTCEKYHGEMEIPYGDPKSERDSYKLTTTLYIEEE